jgi:hypothetical protein
MLLSFAYLAFLPVLRLLVGRWRSKVAPYEAPLPRRRRVADGNGQNITVLAHGAVCTRSVRFGRPARSLGLAEHQQLKQPPQRPIEKR